jgi:hypothetical protein
MPFGATPFITADNLDQSFTQKTPVDISNSLQQVAVRVDENELVTTAEKLSVALVAAVVSLVFGYTPRSNDVCLLKCLLQECGTACSNDSASGSKRLSACVPHV